MAVQYELASIPFCATVSLILRILPHAPILTAWNTHSETGENAHSTVAVRHNSATFTFLHHCILLTPPSPLSQSTEPLKHFPSFSLERLMCDWACCVFYRHLAAARGQRAVEMPQCLYILPVRRCKRMKRDWHSIIHAQKLKYSRGCMEADKEDEKKEEEEESVL